MHAWQTHYTISVCDPQPNPDRAGGLTQEVRTLGVPGAAGIGAAAGASPHPAAVWRAPAPLLSAAVLGGTVAVGYGRTAQVLTVDPADGSLACGRELQYAQQLSALALFVLPPDPNPDPGSGSALWLAAGLWVANCVELRPLPAAQGAEPGVGSGLPGMAAAGEAGGPGGAPQAVTVHLGARQARAIAVGELGGRAHVFVGTACGALVAQELAAGAGLGSAGPGAPREGLRLLDSSSYQARGLRSLSVALRPGHPCPGLLMARYRDVVGCLHANVLWVPVHKVIVCCTSAEAHLPQVGVAPVDTVYHVGPRGGAGAAVYALAEEGLILRATPRRARRGRQAGTVSGSKVQGCCFCRSEGVGS